MDELITAFKTQGYLVLENLFDEHQLIDIQKKIDYFFDNNQCLGDAINVLALSPDELMTYGAIKEGAANSNPNYYIPNRRIRSGDKSYRELSLGQSLIEPLLNVPEIFDLIVNDEILGCVKEYFSSDMVKIGYVKVRRFYANEVPDFDTNNFHIDDNSQNLIKAIIYLNDITSIDDGVFCYVPGSQKNPILEESFSDIHPYVRSDEQILQYYGVKSVKKIFGPRGTTVLADTLGYHKGYKTRTRDRTVLYVNYVLEEEYNGTGIRQQVLKKSLHKRPELSELFDFFEAV